MLTASSIVAAPAEADMVWSRGETADPGSLDPHRATTSVEQHILDELYEGLTVYDGHGQLQPGVASTWQISDDGLTYTFDLRPDARWSDGSPVTADDFVFSLRRLMDPATGAPYANLLYAIGNAREVNGGRLPPERLRVQALAPNKLAIGLEQPTSTFLDQLTHMTAMPVSRKALAQWGPRFTRGGHLVGNGAFVLRRYIPNDKLELARNPFFHDVAHVALDREIIVPIDDRAAGLRRFAAGELDSYNEIPADQIGYIRRNFAAALRLTPSLGTYFLTVDCRQPALMSAPLRRALAMAIDRDFLAATVWGGTAKPSYSFVPAGIASYGDPVVPSWTDGSQFTRDDGAARLVTEAGFDRSRPLHLTLRFDQSENHKAMAVAIADMWRPLGIETDLIAQDAASFFAMLASGQSFDVARGGWFADYPDAANYLFLAQSDNPGLNYAHFADPEFDRLMRAADASRRAPARAGLLHKAEARLLDQAPYLPLLTYDAPNLVSDRLQGWTSNVLDHHPGRFISKR